VEYEESKDDTQAVVEESTWAKGILQIIGGLNQVKKRPHLENEPESPLQKN